MGRFSNLGVSADRDPCGRARRRRHAQRLGRRPRTHAEARRARARRRDRWQADHHGRRLRRGRGCGLQCQGRHQAGVLPYQGRRRRQADDGSGRRQGRIRHGCRARGGPRVPRRLGTSRT